jgi:hypothetical protein
MEELKAILGLKEFIDHPDRYGSTITIDDEAYDRIAHLFAKADEAVAAVLCRSLSEKAL